MFRCQGLADPLSKKAFSGAFGQGRHPFSGEVFVPLFSERGASWAFSIGVPGELIQLYGDWASEC